MKNIATTLSIALLCLFSYTTFSQNKYPSVLWEIKKPKSTKPSYLFGTYHLSDKGVFKLADSLFYALKNSDIVATEVNDDTWQQSSASFDDIKNKYNFYSRYYYGSFIHEGVLRKTNTIQKLPVFISFQPNAINYFLYRNTDAGDGFEEEAYLDRFISLAGYKYGKQTRGLENIIESEIKQIEGSKDEEMLDKQENKKLPGNLSETELNALIFDGYKNNSLDMMDSLDKYNFTSEVYRNKFITARNYDQADSIDYYIRQGQTIFAAVGSAHLPGAEGVIEILRKKGYQLRPVKLSGHNKDEIEAIKKKIIPVKLSSQTLEGGLSFMAPGKLNPHFSNSLLKIYAYVDMANGGYYLVSRMYNNSFYFGKNQQDVIHAIDSLLYENIEGDIKDKKIFTYKGYPAIDVVSQVKNKDFERYRFIATPYEVLKIKSAGKNEYAQMPVIDDFFNSFSISQEMPVDAENGLQMAYNTNQWHTWFGDEFGAATKKIRFSNYDADKKVMNGVLKISLADKELKPDNEYLQLAAESLTSSYALKENESKQLDFSKPFQENIQLYALQSGGTLAVKTIIRHPSLFVIYSASASAKPDTAWMNKVILQETPVNSSFSFTDTMRGFSCQLPYDLTFDNKWKAASERKTEKYDPDKKANRNEALNYNCKNIYTEGNWDLFTFQHPKSLEVIWGGVFALDNDYYFSSASRFWNQVIPKPYNSAYNNSKSPGGNYNSDLYYKGHQLGKPTSYISNLTYDTISRDLQQISYFKNDSLSQKAVFCKTILYKHRLYEFETIVPAGTKELPPFFADFISSFKPINENASINIYEKKLQPLIDAYLKAPLLKKSDLAECLNKFHFEAGDITDINLALAKLSPKTPGNNILRKKLVAALAECAEKDKNWPQISEWLKKLYNNTDELLTIRIFALSEILNKHDERDADWVMGNIASNPDFRSSAVRTALTDYFTKINNKEAVKTKLSMTHFGSGASVHFPALSLYDSGYFNNEEMKKVFSDISKLAEDEKSGFQLQAEGELFKYPEDAGKKSVSDIRYNDNFQFVNAMFTLFYSADPGEPFFKESFEKINKQGTLKDKLDLVKIFAKQKKEPVDWSRKLLSSLSNEKTLYMDVFKTYLYYDKVNTLPEVFKNKIDIAQSYLRLNEDYYTNIDTIYFFGSSLSPYKKNETCYFFKYRNKKELNEQIAYVTLPNDLSIVLTPKKIKYDFTDEQVLGNETYLELSKRLMRRQYINSIYDDGDAKFYLEEKDEKSLDVKE